MATREEIKEFMTPADYRELSATAFRRIVVSLVLCYFGIALLHVYWGRVHVDEGAYLYAANAVYRGLIPYRDFFYLQPPIHPYVYGFPQVLFGPGLLIGRLTSLAFALGILGLGIGTAGRLSGRHAAVIFLALMVSNPTLNYFFTITRLYALTGFLFMVAVYASASSVKTYGSQILSMVFMSLTTLTRLTAAPGMVMLTWYVVTRNRRRITRSLTTIGIGAVIVLAGYGLFYYLAADRFWFNIIGLNLTLHSRNVLLNLTAKARTMVHLVKHNLFLWICLGGVIIGKASHIRTSVKQWLIAPTPKVMLWGLVAAISAGHFSAKIFQESYQSFIMPLIMLLVAVELAEWYRAAAHQLRKQAAALFLVGCWLTLVSHGRENLQVVNGQSPLGLITEQAEFIRRHTQPEDLIFSADSALLAVETNREILPGMAGSDYFPAWDTQKCLRYRVTNTEIVTTYLTEQLGKVVIIGDLSYTLTLPELESVPEQTRQAIWEVLETHYWKAREDLNLHVPGSKVYFYLPKPGPQEDVSDATSPLDS